MNSKKHFYVAFMALSIGQVAAVDVKQAAQKIAWRAGPTIASGALFCAAALYEWKKLTPEVRAELADMGIVTSRQYVAYAIKRSTFKPDKFFREHALLTAAFATFATAAVFDSSRAIAHAVQAKKMQSSPHNHPKDKPPKNSSVIIDEPIDTITSKSTAEPIETAAENQKPSIMAEVTDTIKNGFKNFFASAPKDQSVAQPEKIEQPASVIENNGPSLLDKAKSTASETFNTVATELNTELNNVESMVGDVTQGIKNLFSSAGTAKEDAKTPATEENSDLSSSDSDINVVTEKSALQSAQDVSNVPVNLPAAEASMLDNIGQTIAPIAQEAQQKFEELKAATETKFAELQKTVAPAIEQTKAVMATKAGEIAQTAGQTINTMKTSAQVATENVKSTLTKGFTSITSLWGRK